MFNLITGLTLVAVLAGCGGKKGEEPLACKMTKQEAEAIAKKINDDYEAANKAFENYTNKTDETKDIDDLHKIANRLIPLSTVKEITTPLNEIFDVKGSFDVILKLFGVVNELTESTILTPWRIAIKLEKEPIVEISKIVGIIKEYKLDGILNCHLENLKQKVAKLDKAKYAKTLELYSLLMQAKNIYDDPKGSLMSISQGVNELSGNFEKTKALAELEWK